MKDKEIERLALERFPDNEFVSTPIINEKYRSIFIEGAKAMRERFKQDIIEAYCEGFTSTESAEQYYERRYNGQG